MSLLRVRSMRIRHDTAVACAGHGTRPGHEARCMLPGGTHWRLVGLLLVALCCVAHGNLHDELQRLTHGVSGDRSSSGSSNSELLDDTDEDSNTSPDSSPDTSTDDECDDDDPASQCRTSSSPPKPTQDVWKRGHIRAPRWDDAYNLCHSRRSEWRHRSLPGPLDIEEDPVGWDPVRMMKKHKDSKHPLGFLKHHPQFRQLQKLAVIDRNALPKILQRFGVGSRMGKIYKNGVFDVFMKHSDDFLLMMMEDCCKVIKSCTRPPPPKRKRWKIGKRKKKPKQDYYIHPWLF